MLIKCSKGMFILKRNFRDAFNEEAFCEAYLEECFDNDTYIIGDIAAGLLRLKGFNTDPNSESFYGNMGEYLTHSCVIGSPYYVLERIKNEEEFKKIEKDPKRSETLTDGFLITPIQKENFDKETLELKSNPKTKPNIELNMKKINSLPQGYLPDDLKEDNYKEYKNNKEQDKKEAEPENTQTYVSSSNGFDPTKVNRGKNNFRNNQNNNSNNNNNQQKPKNDNSNNNQNNKKKFKNKKKFFNNKENQ